MVIDEVSQVDSDVKHATAPVTPEGEEEKKLASQQFSTIRSAATDAV
jgi:hypothetical protein